MPEPAPAEEAPGGWRFDAIGTRWEITSREPLDETTRDRIGTVIADFDHVWSRFREDSLVTRTSRDPGPFPLALRPDADGRAMLDLYATLASATGGALNPLVGRALEHLGYDASYSLRPRPGRLAVPRWRDAVTWDGETLTLHEPVLVDVGAVGKGRLVDLVAGVLIEHGHTEFVVDAGGDLLHRGADPIRVGLEHPEDPGRAIGVIQLQNAALCASGTNRRTWGPGLHHILDGRTGRPVGDVVATWATAATAMAADGAASALFFLMPHQVPTARAAVRLDAGHRAHALGLDPGSGNELFTTASVAASRAEAPTPPAAAPSAARPEQENTA